MINVRKALRPVKRRIRRNRFLQGAAAGLAAGCAAAALLQLISLLTPIADRGWLALPVAAGAALAAGAVNALRPVSDRAAAEAADATGLKERAITALESGDSEICRLQRQDAAEALEALDTRRIRPGSAKKRLLAALACAAAAAALILIPNAQDKRAQDYRALRQTLEEGTRKIEQAAETDEDSASEEEKRELRKLTEDLKRELAQSRDAADAMVALGRAEQRLEQLRRQSAGDALAAADAAADGEAAEGRDGGEGEAGEGEAAEGNASQQGAQGQASAPSAAQASIGSNLQGAMSGLKASISPSGLQGSAGQSGSGNGEGNKDGNGSGSGSGGEGKKSGGGAGEGSTNLEEEAGGQHSGSQGGGNRDPRYKETKYETIYDPEHADLASQDEMTGQQRQEGNDSVQLETGPGRGSVSGDVPWGEVLAEYAEAEARAAEREALTLRERQWVTDYYSLLTEQN